jgi:hypothetical protein
MENTFRDLNDFKEELQADFNLQREFQQDPGAA